MKPKLKEHLHMEMIEELKKLMDLAVYKVRSFDNKNYMKQRQDIGRVILKYIDIEKIGDL